MLRWSEVGAGILESHYPPNDSPLLPIPRKIRWSLFPLVLTYSSLLIFLFKSEGVKTSLAAQWLELHFPVQGMQFDPWWGNWNRTCLATRQKKKGKKERNNIVTNSIKPLKKKLRCSRGKLSGCYKLLPSAFRGLWAFWELQRKQVLPLLFTGGSALSQDEGEDWYACAEHPLCKQGLALHQKLTPCTGGMIW